MKLPLYYYGHPILRKKSRPVEKVTDHIRELIANMIETMDENNGVGLAANQVGHILRIFIIRPVETDANGQYILGPIEIYINPVLTDPSEEIVVGEEGCLSIPGVHEHVERPHSVYIEALNIDEKKISTRIEGFKAREIMHENDHLHGVLFIDRIHGQRRKELDPILREVKKKYSSS